MFESLANDFGDQLANGVSALRNTTIGTAVNQARAIATGQSIAPDASTLGVPTIPTPKTDTAGTVVALPAKGGLPYGKIALVVVGIAAAFYFLRKK